MLQDLFNTCSRYRCLILWITLLSPVGLPAQEVPHIRNFLPNDYGGQNQNWSLTQSPDGCIWAGNTGGLLRFDGTKWQLLELPEKQTIRAVAAGDNGTIFCGGFAEFGYWRSGPGGKLLYTSLSQSVNSDRIGKEEIWHIFFGDGCVFFQSFSLIYRYDYQKVVELTAPNAIMFAAQTEGHIWVPTFWHGLYELMPDGSFRFEAGTEILKDKTVQFIVPNGNGGLWAGTANHGIYEIKQGQCRPWANPLNNEFKKQHLNKALRLRNGNWAFGTILGGVFIVDKQQQLLFHIDHSNGLQNNTVLSLTEDRNGNLWTGLDHGIDFIQLNAFLTFFTDQTGKIGTVYTAAKREGRLYIGTNQGVFSKPDDGSKTATFQLLEGSQGQVWQLREVDGQLLCGHNSGTFIIEPHHFRQISDVTGGWHTIPIPRHPDLMLQSTYTGLVLFKKDRTGKYSFFDRVKGFVEPLKKIVFDAQGMLWGVHPNKGLFRLQLSNNFLTVLTVRTYTQSDGLPSDFKLGLTDLNGQLVINAYPTARQIILQQNNIAFNPLQHEPTVWKWLQGAPNEAFALEKSRLFLYEGTEKKYEIPLRLVPDFENIVALPDSTYLFCLENGYAKLDRRRILAVAPAPAPLTPRICAVETTDGHTFAPTDQELCFSYRQNSVKCSFALPFFERPPKFSWQLDGFSTTWSPWQTTSEKEFTNLPEGQYTFRVRTDVNAAEANFAFRVSPPWYRSDWMYLACLFGIVALLFQFEWYNRRRLARQRQRLEAEKEREILLLKVENQNRELSNAAFSLIRKNEALLGLKDDLLNTAADPNSTRKIVRRIDAQLEGDHVWEMFEESFNQVHNDFFKRLLQEFPELTPGDLRLAAYLKMNLSSKEIAPLLNISVRGIENKRYRLRKKMGLPEDHNLAEFILKY